MALLPESDRDGLRCNDSLAAAASPADSPDSSSSNAWKQQWRSAVYAEALGLVGLALPVMCSYVLQYSMGIISLVAAARFGVPEMDGLSMGRLFANVTGIYLVLGLVLAMDALCTQAFGAKNFFLVGEVAQRAALITALCSIPVLLLWWNVVPIFQLLGQDPVVTQLASQFLRYLSPGLYPLIMFEIIKKYLQVQGVVYPIFWILITALCFHAAITYLLMWPCGLGYNGSPLALTLSWTFMMTLSLAYVRFAHLCQPSHAKPGPLRCWGGFSRTAFHTWGPFLRLGIPSAAQLCLDWWACEALLFEAGVLGLGELAASVINMQLAAFCFMFPFGLAVAASVRVGQHLGAGAPDAAHLASQTAISVIVLLELIVSMGVFFVQPIWAAVYTRDESVLAVNAQLPLLIAFYHCFDAMQTVMGGILRAAGLPVWGAIINFVAQWCIGLPLSAAAAFACGWGLQGLWIGVLCGVVLEPLLAGVVIWRLDWSALSRAAQLRAGVYASHTVEV